MNRTERWRIPLIWMILFAVSATVRSQAKPGDGDPPSVSMVISFDQQTIREHEPVGVTLWLSNSSAQTLSDVQLHIASPDFLEWRWDTPKGTVLKQPKTLGALLPNAVLPPRKLSVQLKPGSDVTAGDFNILFICQYEWTVKNSRQRAIITSEKPLKVNIFGTDTVVGIPLAFAGFVVPGLLFLFVLRLFKVAWCLALDTDEKLILSIAVSVLCSVVGSWLHHWMSWLDYLDLSSNISIPKLFALAITGIVLGVIVGYIYTRCQQRRRKHEEADLIGGNDDCTTIVRKVLKLNRNYSGKPVVVRLKDKREYIGSHSAKTVDETFLVGSFEIVTKGMGEGKIKALEEEVGSGSSLVQDYSHVSGVIKILMREEPGGLATAKRPDFVKPSTGVKVLVEGVQGPTGQAYMKWKNEEVSSDLSNYGKFPELLIYNDVPK